MIKATQLQIGDFVLYRGTPIRVEAITKKKVGYHITPNDKGLYYARLHDVEPIEVTHELLDANGFKGDTCYWKMHIDEHNTAQYYFHESRLEKFWYGKDEWQNNTWIRDVTFSANGLRYLHQLQQACRMCGVEIDWKV